MPIADWIIYKSDALCVASISLSTPLVDSGSLLLGDGGAVGSEVVHLQPGPAIPHGLTRGKMRTLLRADSMGGAAWQRAGLFFMSSQSDLTTAGSCYGLVALFTIGGTAVRIALHKFTAGLGAPVITAGNIDDVTVSIVAGTLMSLEVEWNLDVEELGGIQIIARRGALADFSDLAEDMNQTIVASYLETSVGEGPCIFTNTGTHSTRFDMTRITELI